MSKTEKESILTSENRELIRGIIIGVSTFTKQLDLKAHHGAQFMVPLIYHYFPDISNDELQPIIKSTLESLVADAESGEGEHVH